ncbi:MAG: hypothetical protein K2U26_08130, partial [Cyclobacteriaceae bacterium]|nr:hypothetical protein [Cyclobacteriaceae bacterium]
MYGGMFGRLAGTLGFFGSMLPSLGDLDAVKNGSMSLETYGKKYGTSYTSSSEWVVVSGLYGYSYASDGSLLNLDPVYDEKITWNATTKWVGTAAVYNWGVREFYYSPQVRSLSVYYGQPYDVLVFASSQRNSIVLETRALSTPDYAALSEWQKPANSMKINPNGNFAKPNATVMNGMRFVGAAGGVMMGYAAYQSYQNVSNAQNKGAALVQEGFSWGGALAGGWAGAKSGAALGGAVGSFFPGVGNAAGATVGGFVGGIAGSIAGGWFGTSLGSKVSSK